MPALIRTLAFTGAVFFLFSSLTAVPASAQNSDAAMPTITAAPAAPAAPAPAPAATLAPAPEMPTVTTPELGAPDSTASTTTPATHHKTVHHKTTHHKVVHHSSKKHKAVKKSSKKGKKGKAKSKSGDQHVHDAQQYLTNLGYYKGKVDGLNGPQTKAALKKFQKDQKLPVNGKLTKKTFDALVQADKEKAMAALPPIVEAKREPPPRPVVVPPMPEEEPLPNPGPDFYATHPDFYGHYHQAYENPMLLGPTQTLFSRFAQIVLTEDTGADGMKKYNITLNGLPLILVDGQPSVIGVSRTFSIGDEDLIIFTTFKDHDPVCAYEYNLLILTPDGTQSRAIDNCTRGYQANVKNGALIITFPETDDARAVGNTWRYEHGDLERL